MPLSPPVPPEFRPASPADPPPPIADYELLRLIGRGSYGDVWLARGVTGVFRAVKVVWRDRFADVRPYEREFEGITRFTAISLREPSQLALLHAGRQDAVGFFYYVMELADDTTRGREIDPARYAPCTLKDFAAARGRRLEIAEVVALGTALARALASLHAAGLVHRDIKPSNVILVGGVPKFADVGLVAPASAQLTFVGTEGFVPPEGPGAPSADVYSLGKLLYELATGLDRHDYPRLPPDLDTRPDQRALLELNEVLVRACEPDARQRFADAGALLDELLLLQAGKSVRRLRRAERRTARALRFAAVLAVIAGLAGAGAWVERARAEEEMKLRLAAEAERDAERTFSVYSATLARAQRALETEDYGGARKLLASLTPAAGQADIRGFEWHALRHEAQGDAAEILRESGPTAYKARISPDGSLIAIHDAEQTVALCDAKTFKELRRVAGVYNFTGFSTDGAWLIGSTPKFAFQRWRVSDGMPDELPAPGTNRPLKILGGSRGVSFVDGTSSTPHAIRTWDFTSHAELSRVEVPRQTASGIWNYYRATISDDGKLAAVSLIKGQVHDATWMLRIYDLDAQRLLHEEPSRHRITALRFSPDARHLAFANGDLAEVTLLDLPTFSRLWRRTTGRSQTNVIVFAPDGRRLAIGGRGALVQILATADGEEALALRGHSTGIEDISWLPEGNGLLSCSAAGQVRLWSDLKGSSGRQLVGLGKPAGGGRRLCLSPDGRRLAATNENPRGAIVTTVSNPSKRVLTSEAWVPVAFSPTGESVFGVRRDGMFQRWHLGSEAKMAEEFRLFDGEVTIGSAAALSRDGRVLAVGATSGPLNVWRMPEKTQMASIDGQWGQIWFVALSPDGSRVICGGSARGRGAGLWDSAKGELLGNLVTAAQALSAAYDPSGKLAALGCEDGTVAFFDAVTGKPLQTTATGSARIQSLAFSPDGSRLVCGAPEGAVHVLQLGTAPREILTLRLHAVPGEASDTTVSDVAFSADGRVLAAYANDGRIESWRGP